MKKLLILVLAISIAACQSGGQKTTQNGVIVKLKNAPTGSFKMVKVEFLSEKIVKVSATAENSFSSDTSIMAINTKPEPVNFTSKTTNGIIEMKTKQLLVKLSLADGNIEFLDTLGNSILKEQATSSKTFTPISINGKNFWSIRQIFDSPADEAFYGLGQHQNRQMNYKNEDVDLYQYNTKVAVPFVISSKKYGMLWDNYSQSKFGDARDFAPLSQFKLYGTDGKPGGLTATYKSARDKNKVFVCQQETVIDYEFLPNLKNIPAMFHMGQGVVDWEGSLEPDTTGEYKFRFYSAGYAKVWIGGTLVVDRWRQAWNPSTTYFRAMMKKGEKTTIKIEWNPDGGESYVGLKALSPLPRNEQGQLSLSSEVAKQINYFFIKGDDIDDVISGYRKVTGKAPIMPKWALGFWQSRERYKTQEELLGVVKEFRKRQIPIDNIVLDWFYWPQDKWGSHDFDSTRFPDPKGMIKTLHDSLNARLMISVWGKFYEGTDNYNKLNEKGYLYMENIKQQRKDWVGPGYHSTFYDAMNPEGRKMFWEMMNEKLFSKGVDAWWMDASEPDLHSNLPPAERKAFMDPTALGPGAQYFNSYPYCNAKGIYEGQRSVNPDQRVYILTRSAYAGQQRFAAATWSGDIGARWDEMETQISAGLNFCISGIPYWTTDIGGFAVERKYERAKGELLEEWREQYVRWYQYGAFCPIFRVHGQFPFREIFNIAPETHPAYQAMIGFDKLRYKLMPYIYTLAGKVYFNDYTIMRPLVMDFLSDVKVQKIANEFMFGPSILVCPVTQYKERSREVYLPSETGWYDLFTGKYYSGGTTIKADAPLSHIPLFVKEGSIVPIGPDIQSTAEKTDGSISLLVYTGKDAQFDIYEDEAINYNYEKGSCSKIPVSYNENTGEVKIGNIIGSYPGMPRSRKITIYKISKSSGQGINELKIALDPINYEGKEISINISK
jgi:alpha-D-xyloside xylohydrolase